MGKTNLYGLFTLCLTGFLLGGCASSTPEPEAPIADVPSAEVIEAPVAAEPRIEDGKLVFPVGDGTDATEVLEGVFYFDFDQAIVKRVNHTELDKHAQVIRADPSIQFRLEGHADERGTREYNLALGERRAIAVGAYLIDQGASRSQFEVISYGEEKPVNAAHDESAWALNRRVEIVYK